LNESPAADMIPDDLSVAADESLRETSTEAQSETPEKQEEADTVRVAIVKTANREEGVARAVALLGEINFSRKDVFLKCSYNSPDAFPATTHPYALGAMVRMLRGKGAGKVTLVERSGMGRTREVLEKLGVFAALEKLEAPFCLLDELPAEEWRYIAQDRSHWPKGMEFPRFLTQDTCIVQLCNLKTHRFGGRFSASLKNSIGLIAKYAASPESGLTEKDEKNAGRGWNYMKDLHSSSYQSEMIAEANQTYSPELIVMDATEVFVSGGPEKGVTAAPEIIAASCDRVAIDAVGFTILKYAGAQMSGPGKIFEQPQIKRAVQLNLGARSPEMINVVSDDNAGRLLASRLKELLS